MIERSDALNYAMAGEHLVNCMADGEPVGPASLRVLHEFISETGTEREARFVSALIAAGVVDQRHAGLSVPDLIDRLEAEG